MVPPALPPAAAPAAAVEPSAHLRVEAPSAEFRAPVEPDERRSGKPDEKRSGEKKARRSGQEQPLQKPVVTEARTLPARTSEKGTPRPDFYVEVSDVEMLDLIRGDRVKVERSGSRRQNKDGTVRDYRGKYVAIRERAGQRRVLAFGKAEMMVDYLANRLRVHYCQNCATVTIDPCSKCRA
jgi:hypothetical protein